ncbi:MAG: hypothetical protein IAF08_00515, partial [Rhizobacter sp.]|nr:hypothetical protein [Chlorobiales bacterium]
AKRLREILERIAAQGIAAQHTELEQSLVKHQGAEAQRDDITVMGIRVRITE